MQKAHIPINWENYPSDKTPVNEQNLNKMDVSIGVVDDRVIVLDTTKLDKTDAQHFVKSITLDRDTGIFTISYFNGSFDIIDTLLEKIAVNFGYDATTQKLSITLDDGTIEYIDLSALITQYEFLDSDTIAFQVQADGKIKAVVKEGSIEEKHLRPDYLADIRVEAAKAEASRDAAAESAKNALESEKKAKESEANAAGSAEEAKQYKTDAETAELNAKASEDAAKVSESNALESEAAARESEEASALSAQSASDSASQASESALDSAESASKSEDFSKISKSYAVGTNDEFRPNDSNDNSKFYSEIAKTLTDEAQKLLDQAQKIIAAASTGALIPAGTIGFEDLPENPQVGYMYNISNDFTTDERFVEGSGIFYRAGANIYWTKDEQWDVMVGTQVTGVKGSEEENYRIGNVDITKENIGLGNVENTADKEKKVLSAEKLKNGRYINNTFFDGTKDIRLKEAFNISFPTLQTNGGRFYSFAKIIKNQGSNTGEGMVLISNLGPKYGKKGSVIISFGVSESGTIHMDCTALIKPVMTTSASWGFAYCERDGVVYFGVYHNFYNNEVDNVTVMILTPATKNMISYKCEEVADISGIVYANIEYPFTNLLSYNGTKLEAYSVSNYGVCNSDGVASVKTVNLYSQNSFFLTIGAEVTVKFKYTNSASNIRLNVNGTGNKYIYHSGSIIAKDSIIANRTYTFRYNGTGYDLVDGTIARRPKIGIYKVPEGTKIGPGSGEYVEAICGHYVGDDIGGGGNGFLFSPIPFLYISSTSYNGGSYKVKITRKFHQPEIDAAIDIAPAYIMIIKQLDYI